MSITPSLYALLFTATLIPAMASAQDTSAQDTSTQNTTRTPNPTAPPTTTGSAVADPSRQAPVGHRQPRAADIPANRSGADDDAWLDRVNRDIDSKLKICRDC